MFHLHLADGFVSVPFALDACRLTLRATLGPFFAISGAHKLLSPTRRASLAATFKADGCYSPAMMWAIPCGELCGGLGVLTGTLLPFACAGLMLICLGACALDGRKRVAGFQPLDASDRLDDWLYLPEALYLAMLAVLAILGAGALSLDALI